MASLEFDVKRVKDVPAARSTGRPPRDYVKELAPLRRSPGKPFELTTMVKVADAAAARNAIIIGLAGQGVVGDYEIAVRTIEGVPTVLGVYKGTLVAPKPAEKPEKPAEKPAAKKFAAKKPAAKPVAEVAEAAEAPVEATV